MNPGTLGQQVEGTVRHLPGGVGSQIMIKYYQQYCCYLETKVEQTADQLELLLESSEGGTFTYNADGDYLRWDERSFEIFGIREDEFTDDYASWIKLVHPRDREEFQQKIMNLSQQEGSNRFYASYRILRNDGQTRFVYSRGKVIRDIQGKMKAIHGVHLDVTGKRTFDRALIESYQNHRNLAQIDSLTGIYNRRYFLQRMEEELKRSRRYGYAISFLMIDLDHFKQINDQYGHDAGDRVIRQMAQASRKILRKTDIFGRLGGEEFGVGLVQADAGLGLKMARRLSDRISKIKIRHLDEEIGFTITIGLACCRGGNRTLDEVMKEADRYLYAAKTAGRNRIAWEITS